MRKDFNIEDEARIAEKPIIIPLKNVIVTNNVLEVRFYFAGKGTTRIPNRGVYGPLISAVSVVSGESLLRMFLFFFSVVSSLWYIPCVSCKALLFAKWVMFWDQEGPYFKDIIIIFCYLIVTLLHVGYALHKFERKCPDQ